MKVIRAEAMGLCFGVRDALKLAAETPELERLYGIDNETTAPYGRRLLAARRLAERGVRFTQIFIRQWDQHGNLPKDIRRQCGIIEIDRDIEIGVA